ncbi:MAG: hypothetical protein ACP6IP_09555 [Candidatus Njordarchaeia archaeon]
MLIKVRCPQCGEKVSAEIDVEYLKKSESGLTPVAFPHGNPKHILVLYLDRQGRHRGYEILNSVVESTINVDDLIKMIGKKELARLLAAVIQDAEIYINMDRTTARLLQKFLVLIGHRKFVKLVYDKKRAKYRFDLIRRKTDKVVGEKYFLRVLNQLNKLSDNQSKLALLKMAVSKISSLYQEAKGILEKAEVSPEKVIKAKLDLDSESWELLESMLVREKFGRKLAASGLEVVLRA